MIREGPVTEGGQKTKTITAEPATAASDSSAVHRLINRINKPSWINYSFLVSKSNFVAGKKKRKELEPLPLPVVQKEPATCRHG